MRYYHKYFLILISLVFGFSCYPENLEIYQETQIYCEENMFFNCSDAPLGEIYFKGNINCKSFCISYPNDAFWYSNSIGVTSTTSSSSPNLNSSSSLSSFFQFGLFPPIYDNEIGISQDFSPTVRLNTPSIIDSVYSENFYIEEFVEKGPLILQNPNIDKSSGWDFSIYWSCVHLPGYDNYKSKNESYVPVVGITISPSVKSQDDAIFEISQMNITRIDDLTTYDITFKIECDLYIEGGYNKGEYFGRLEDGEFRTLLTVQN